MILSEGEMGNVNITYAAISCQVWSCMKGEGHPLMSHANDTNNFPSLGCPSIAGTQWRERQAAWSGYD